jgi:hypothetical protein
MRILIDMNLTPRWLNTLTAQVIRLATGPPLVPQRRRIGKSAITPERKDT